MLIPEPKRKHGLKIENGVSQTDIDNLASRSYRAGYKAGHQAGQTGTRLSLSAQARARERKADTEATAWGWLAAWLEEGGVEEEDVLVDDDE